MADPLTYPPEIIFESTQEAWDLVIEKYPCDDGLNPELVVEIGALVFDLILEVLSHL